LNIRIKFHCFLVAIVGLIVMLSPFSVLAQEWKDGLILRYLSGGYNSEVVPGESKTFFIEVANNSNVSTIDILFTSNAPKGWLVEFKPHNFAAINADGFQTVEVQITPPQRAEKGDYSVTVIADSSVGRRVMDIYVRVEQGTNLWIWVGAILGLVVIAAFVIIFRRFNRD
jgi:uncharacterized membrane protein